MQTTASIITNTRTRNVHQEVKKETVVQPCDEILLHTERERILTVWTNLKMLCRVREVRQKSTRHIIPPPQNSRKGEQPQMTGDQELPGYSIEIHGKGAGGNFWSKRLWE